MFCEYANHQAKINIPFAAKIKSTLHDADRDRELMSMHILSVILTL